MADNDAPDNSTPYAFVEVWVHTDPVGADRECYTRICDENDGKPVSRVGRPPAHPNCFCETRVGLRPASEE